jgi:nuclear transport factor 2 (NTF2) superfamily protein
MDTAPASIVQAAEDAYNALEIERILALFTSDIVFDENGRRAAEGMTELRRWHEAFLASVEEFRISKTLRVAAGNLIGVEYSSSFRHPRTGARMESFGGEFWTMRGDQLAEWHLHWRAYEIG